MQSRTKAQIQAEVESIKTIISKFWQLSTPLPFLIKQHRGIIQQGRVA